MEIYEFGSFRLDVAERSLFYEGQIVSLSAKLFDILLLLVRNNGNLVTKDNLIKEIWANNIVEESNLTVSICYIRKVLDKDKKRQSYIQTVSRYGYRFAAKVKIINDSETTQNIRNKDLITDSNQAENVINSIAILPFENISKDPNLEYLCDGITESLIYSLSRLPQLKVLARSTVFRYKNSEINTQQIGRTLSVQAVLTGRIFQISDRIFISIELVDIIEGTQVWGEQYNRELAEILPIQDEIVQLTVEKLKLKLDRKKEEQLIKHYTENSEAYHHYLRGRYFWNKFTEKGFKKSIECYQKAIESDANYALAYAGLAESYFKLSNVYINPKEALPIAKAMAIKSVEIDPYLPEAYIALGTLKFYCDHDWRGAETAFKEAIKINYSEAFVHFRYAHILMHLGRFDEAFKEFKVCRELDPLALHYNLGFANCLTYMGCYDEAIEQVNKAIELEPNYAAAQFILGWVYLHKGAFKRAIAQFNRSFQLERSAYILGYLGYAYAISGKRKEAEKLLKDLEKRSLQKYVSPFEMAIIFAGLGEKDKAFEYLEKLFHENNDHLAGLKVCLELKSLHLDSRFNEMLKRVGLP
jgi:TolB-like protein/Flp pilus assembly protein TadD